MNGSFFFGVIRGTLAMTEMGFESIIEEGIKNHDITPSGLGQKQQQQQTSSPYKYEVG